MHPPSASAELSTQHVQLLQAFDDGRRTALARTITIVENQRPGFLALLHALHARVGRAHRIGITGPPGAGKSTLSAALVQHLRARGETVGVIAVDPTSPFTGGALLGDRIRMNDVGMDEGVFIRSMATRGSLGGIALATKEIADVMDAFGFDRILLETVGVGQSELDIARAADSTLVVLVPESGDGIQAMKAGLMEAADLFAINKSDRPGADRLAREVAMMLHLRSGETLRNVPAHHGVDTKRAARRIGGATARAQRAEAKAKAEAGSAAKAEAGSAAKAEAGSAAKAEAGSAAEAGPTARAEAVAGAPQPPVGPGPQPWEIPVLQTIADQSKGIDELASALDRHRSWLEASGELMQRRRARLAERVREQVARSMQRHVWQERGGADLLENALETLVAGEETPYDVAARIVRAALDGGNAPPPEG